MVRHYRYVTIVFIMAISAMPIFGLLFRSAGLYDEGRAVKPCFDTSYERQIENER